ncbi:MAG: hypothetical protein V1888_03605 [archaeon]
MEDRMSTARLEVLLRREHRPKDFVGFLESNREEVVDYYVNLCELDFGEAERAYQQLLDDAREDENSCHYKKYRGLNKSGVRYPRDIRINPIF